MTKTSNPVAATETNVSGDPTTTADAFQPRPTKINAVLALLQRAEGAALSEITAATGWQKHTARAALTGLKKKGHSIKRAKTDDGSRYLIISSEADQ